MFREESFSVHSQVAVIRASAAALALLPIVLLGTAGELTPSPSGIGTHQQLGLSPCTMRVLAGVRCPGCGMTTSWAYFMNAQWNESMAANFGGFLLALYSIGFAAVCLRVTLVGRLPSVDVQRFFAIALLAITAVTLVTWGWKLL